MGGLRRKRRSKTTAPATVMFTKANNESGKKQLCVFAQCDFAETVAGPIWSHSAAAVRRCLAALTSKCDCGRPFHKAREYAGSRVLVARRA